MSVSEKPAAAVSTLNRHREEVSEDKFILNIQPSDYFRKCKDAWGMKRAKQVTLDITIN